MMIPFSFWGGQINSISGLQLLLDAENYDASTGTWTDTSGQGHHATQATAGNRPTKTAGAINGKPVVTLDGVNDYLSNASFPALGSGGRTVVVIGKGGGAGFYPIALGATATAGDLYGVTREIFVRCAVRVIDYTTATMDGAYKLITSTCITTTANNKLYVNGTEIAASSFTSPGAINTQSGFVIGNVPSLAATYFTGDIAQIRVYNKVLSSYEREILKQYVRSRYGLTIA